MQKTKQNTESKWGNLNYFNKLNIKNYSLTFLFLTALYFVLYLSIDKSNPFDYKSGIYTSILISVIFAVSLNIAVGLMGQLSLGHAGFIAIGGYTAAFISKLLIPYNLPAFVQLIIVTVTGGILAGIFGFFVGGSTLRLRGDYLAIITLAFGEIIKYVIQNMDFLGGATGLKSIPSILDFSSVYFITVISVIIMSMIMTSRKGRQILSIRENEIAAENIGIDINQVKLYGFALSAFFAGVGGSLFAHNVGILTPDKFGFVFSIEILVMIVFGGLGSITGAVLSAVLLTLLNEQLREVSQYRYLVYAVILIILMIFRPDGVFGKKELTIPRFINKYKRIRNNLNRKNNN
ncbi:MAG: branched-chain amino acid ABC transporter permease [Leptotrichiaceae bacterium]|nr:branched-chain amino acid ABC transporter permease [Leptotrichiaceae bacterium]